ncbi:isopentenyl-diphosphate delta-isomerase [Saccharicrinis sp. FJH54]|uniref:isopentenyl-diphosphate delta-isomerase n=1 Tax=Saccharicrinis sp. FJH54 TaxID=3344665 RepID=UPI0035D3F54A
MKKRKTEHLNLAFQSRTDVSVLDNRFVYEPMFSGHPDQNIPTVELGGKKQKIPVWVSSMTGGTDYAGHINRNLARACGEFGMGMGLGSCRVLLEEDKYLSHFDLRKYLGNEVPFFANLGISQIEKSIRNKSVDDIASMIEKLRADGLIIHINPIQEWLQPEGDNISVPPIETIQTFLEETGIPVIVKEVGQGMGYESLKALLKLPLVAVEFGAFGGTNFARIELERSTPERKKLYEPLAYIGNDAYRMMDYANTIRQSEEDLKCDHLIVSGGLKNYLDGYYFLQKSQFTTIYGHASAFLEHAREEYELLRDFVSSQIKGLQIAYAYLKLNKEY